MTNWLEIAGYSVGGAMLAMMTLGIIFSAFMPALDRWSRGYFITLFSILQLSVTVFFIDALIYRLPEAVTAEKVIVFLEFLTVSAIMPMPTVLLLHWCSESIKNSALFRSVIALWSVFFLLLIAAQFTDVFYYNKYIVSEIVFVRGPWFTLLPLPMALIMALNIAGVIRRRKKFSKKYYIAILVYLLPMTAALFVYLFNHLAIFVVFGMALLAMMLFALILTDSIEQYMRQQREIANQRADIMVLQMRPHFIYNTMMSIYYLCKQDADKAQQVTLDFTDYLRKNFTAIASETVVPFADELKHTQAYLAVEKAQHEDMLVVEYDTPHTRFRVPPLTLQPLVENAVKHGMNPDGDPLHIYIKTRQTNNGSEIIVENDGPDFNPADDNEPHIALNNIRQRLEMMCRGKLKIAPREGGGTVVIVSVPQMGPMQS